MWKWIVLGIIIIAIAAVAGITLFVEWEAPFRSERLVKRGSHKALILYHPSRDAHFSEELTLALAQGFEGNGLSVERWTMSRAAPARPVGFDIIAVVTNTFFGHPDWPTMRYLKRADFKNVPVIAIVAGGGGTERARRTIEKVLDKTGGDVREIRELWISRPNELGKTGVHADTNRALAAAIAQNTASRHTSSANVQIDAH